MLVGLRQLPPGCRVLDASNPALSMHLRQIDDALSYLVPVGPLLVHRSITRGRQHLVIDLRQTCMQRLYEIVSRL